MTTRRYSRDIDRNTRTRMLALVTAASVFVLAVDHFSGGSIRGQLWKIEDQWRTIAGSATASVGSIGYFGSQTSLVEENARLSAQLGQYQTLALSAIALKQENESLARLAGLSQVHPGVSAPVVSIESTGGVFHVGAGSREGVSAGDIVRGEDGYVLGRVVEVTATSAVCRSVFAPGSELEVLIGDTALELSGRGLGNGNGRAPRDSVIAVGDVVTSAAYRGYPVGTVGHIDADPTGAFQQVFVRASRSIDTVRLVFIERP